MASISLCMIVKDEEKSLGRCLDHIKGYIDEIIIVDTGSSDKTKEIAKAYTEHVFDFKWVDDFSAARNFSISKATKEWILIIDADEYIIGEDMEKLRAVIEATDNDGFFLVQRNYTNDSKRAGWVADQSQGYKGYVKNPILRLFRNNKGIKFEGAVYETADKSAMALKISRMELPIHHLYEKTSSSLEQRQLKYLDITEKALSIKEDGRLYAAAAAVYLHFKKDYDKALSYFTKAAALGYKVSNSLEGAAESYIAKNDFESAYKIYKELAKKGYLSPALCNNTANILAMHGHPGPALKFLRLALTLNHPEKERIEKNIQALKRLVEGEEKGQRTEQSNKIS